MEHTETRAHNVVLLRTLADWQIIPQTELFIAVIAAQCLVAVGALVEHEIRHVAGQSEHGA